MLSGVPLLELAVGFLVGDRRVELPVKGEGHGYDLILLLAGGDAGRVERHGAVASGLELDIRPVSGLMVGNPPGPDAEPPGVPVTGVDRDEACTRGRG